MARKNKQEINANFLIGTFSLKRGHHCEILDDWLIVSGEIEDKYLPFLEQHRAILEMEGDFWNEEELKMNFLAYLFFCADLREPEKLQIFYERPLAETIENQNLSVICDCLLAKPFGIYEPQVPYFFLQEFKKQKDAADAEGQMLAAMLIAQQKNATEMPVYGCFLQGKNFVFTTLQQKNYCLSRQFDATITSDLHQIILILRNLKQIILNRYFPVQ